MMVGGGVHRLGRGNMEAVLYKAETIMGQIARKPTASFGAKAHIRLRSCKLINIQPWAEEINPSGDAAIDVQQVASPASGGFLVRVQGQCCRKPTSWRPES
jgi:hypothetical protein